MSDAACFELVDEVVNIRTHLAAGGSSSSRQVRESMEILAQKYPNDTWKGKCRYLVDAIKAVCISVSGEAKVAVNKCFSNQHKCEQNREPMYANASCSRSLVCSSLPHL